MPLDRLILILVVVITAAGLSVWIGASVAAAFQLSSVGWMVIIPLALIVYVGWRVISDRINSAEDDHYDSIDK